MSSSESNKFKLWGIRLFFVSLLASALSILFLDQPLARYFAEGSRENLWVFAREITDIGLGSHYFLGSSLVFLALFVWRKINKNSYLWREPLLHWSAQFFLALCASGVVVFVLKALVGRERPHKSGPDYIQWNFEPLNLHWHYQSFPSGHSQVLFTVATMLTALFPRGAVIFFVLAGGIAFTRVITHSHYLSDCIWGSYLGWLITSFTLLKYKSRGLSNSKVPQGFP